MLGCAVAESGAHKCGWNDWTPVWTSSGEADPGYLSKDPSHNRLPAGPPKVSCPLSCVFRSSKGWGWIPNTEG
jgi:hypothetical protein